MGRPKKVQTPKQEDDSQNLTISTNFAEDFAYRFADVYGKILKQMNNNGNSYLNPLYINNAMKRFQGYGNEPTEANLTKWLKNPRMNEKQLMSVSYFLFDAVEQYNRSIIYLSNLLSFDYELICVNPPQITDDLKLIDLYQRQKQNVNDWLRYFRIKEQLSNIMVEVVRSGGKCYSLRKNNENDGIYLQSLPDDYVSIDGRTDMLGYTFSMNMSYFYQFPDALSGYAPEFEDYWHEFLNKKVLLNDKANPWRLMPYDKSVVFKFDDTRVDIIPPMSGSFLDAVAINQYKELMRLNMELQNYSLLYLKSPLNKEGKPTVDAQSIISYTALVQSLVNPTTSVISSPMDAEIFDFKNASGKDDIVGQGESSFWKSIGIAGGIFGQEQSSAIGLKYSIQSDYDYVASTFYNQFERFLNYHIQNDMKGKFNFKIKFIRRCGFFIEDDKKSTISACQLGLPPERMLAAYGYEPYEIDGLLRESIINKTRDMMIPLQSSYTQSGGGDKGGAPQKSDSELKDSGQKTRDMGSNDLKV